MEPLARALVQGLTFYTLLGVVFAVPFVLRGAARLDPNAAGATWGFRVLILPGSAALWPWLLMRWMRAGAECEESSPHRDAASQGRSS